ncbi:MAG TPA: hypothetical protein VEK11_13345 [Thermoanaerobaculia bacterium]|nr:hypothetical protein [Thermoanaerobaculia bacterium]
MKLVRDRADARHLPSRHNFALFRLGAYLRARNAQPQHADVILVLDRHQSSTETMLVAWWYVLTAACFVTATLFASWPLPLALLAAVPVVLVGVEVPVVFFGVVLPLTRVRVSAVRVNSVLMMAVLGGASAYFVRSASWVRFVGLQVLVLFALNAIAAVIMFLLRDSIARMEASFGGAESAR